VNQVGKRFYDETAGDWPKGTTWGHIDPYVPGSYLNAENLAYKKSNWLDAALAMNEGSTAPDFGAGPVWAIFDSDAVDRQNWVLGPPYTDPEYFFSGDTITQLAHNIKGPYQKIPMNGANLKATIDRYNSFVDTGVDADFGKPRPLYKIQTPPFHAAWASPIVHDTYAGLRINMNCQVQDVRGEVILGLYCGGESAGGSSQHGLARCVTQGYIAGKHAAKLKSWV
jgi:hypothetical protein